MAWFKRKSKGIQTPTESKRDIPKGLWYKSPTGKVVDTEELQENFYVSPEDDYHVRIGSKEYFEILFDNKSFTELDKDLMSSDPLKFSDTKSYKDRVSKSKLFILCFVSNVFALTIVLFVAISLIPPQLCFNI